MMMAGNATWTFRRCEVETVSWKYTRKRYSVRGKLTRRALSPGLSLLQTVKSSLGKGP